MGSVTVPVAVFGVAPKTFQQTDLSNDVSGATPETARETRALPQNVHRKMILARRSSRRDNSIRVNSCNSCQKFSRHDLLSHFLTPLDRFVQNLDAPGCAGAFRNITKWFCHINN
jgi:hypothetical protein